jgi:hypothetical protein
VYARLLLEKHLEEQRVSRSQPSESLAIIKGNEMAHLLCSETGLNISLEVIFKDVDFRSSEQAKVGS